MTRWWHNFISIIAFKYKWLFKSLHRVSVGCWCRYDGLDSFEPRWVDLPLREVPKPFDAPTDRLDIKSETFYWFLPNWLVPNWVAGWAAWAGWGADGTQAAAISLNAIFEMFSGSISTNFNGTSKIVTFSQIIVVVPVHLSYQRRVGIFQSQDILVNSINLYLQIIQLVLVGSNDFHGKLGSEMSAVMWSCNEDFDLVNRTLILSHFLFKRFCQFDKVSAELVEQEKSLRNVQCGIVFIANVA